MSEIEELRPVLRRRYSNLKDEVSIHSGETPLWKARLACELIERWGLVAGHPDGEDAAGRAKMRMLTPAEIVERACETADLAVDAFRAKGWTIALPFPETEEEEETK